MLRQYSFFKEFIERKPSLISSMPLKFDVLFTFAHLFREIHNQVFAGSQLVSCQALED
jgi:hypothetical protein